MKTRKTKNLFFQFRDVIPEGMTVYELAEILTSEGLIEALERDPYHGGILRYAETPALYRSETKERLVQWAIERFKREARHA